MLKMTRPNKNGISNDKRQKLGFIENFESSPFDKSSKRAFGEIILKIDARTLLFIMFINRSSSNFDSLRLSNFYLETI